MKEYKIPDLKFAAQTGALWLLALGIGIALAPSVDGTGLVQKYLAAVMLLGGGAYLFRAGQALGDVKRGSFVLAKEVVRLSERGRKAA